MGNQALLNNDGYALNPTGFNGTKRSRKIKTKAVTALDKAIDMLGTDPEFMGADRLAQLIAGKLEEDVVRTLKDLAFLFPKDVNVDVTHSMSPLQLTDAQLMEIIESRTKVIEGEIVSDDSAANPHSLVDTDVSKCVK